MTFVPRSVTPPTTKILSPEEQRQKDQDDVFSGKLDLMLRNIKYIYPIGSKDQPFYKKKAIYKEKAFEFIHGISPEKHRFSL